MDTQCNINDIKQGLQEVLSSLPTLRLSNLYSTIESALMKLDEPMQLAIIGKISSSKSTLVNAILGKNEVMSTGQMEVTYNVGWLKYGMPNSDIIIHHKDNTPSISKKTEDFIKWSVDGTEQNEARGNISHIEIFDDAEILKQINIIDTPGLDALRGQDSQNTIDFLKNVKPDAVIMLFTHSIAESILDVVKSFNQGGDFNPLNAIGVLAKTDVLWMEDTERQNSALQIGRRIAGNKLKQHPSLRKTLFNIYPISSLLFLKSSTLTQEEFDLLKQLVVNDKEILSCLTLSAMDFVDSDYEVSVGIEERKKLLLALDLYAIELITKMLIASPETTLQEVREMLYRESGAEEFMKTLHNHFGSRAKLIKMESVYREIRKTIQQERNTSENRDILYIFDNLEQRLSEIFSMLVYEHREYMLLNKIYCNEIELEDEVTNEFMRLCGENGYSAPERLGFSPEKSSVKDMIEYVEQREKYWRKEFNNEFDPEEKEWMRTILSSYTQIRSKLKIMNYQYNQAKAFLFNN